MNVTGPASSGGLPGGLAGGLTGLDARALRLLAETLIEGAAREPSRADDRTSARAAQPADRLSVSFDALTAAPLQHLLQTIEQRLFPASVTFENVSAPAAAEAKDAAMRSVDKATQAIENAGIHPPHITESLDPQTVLALATRMIETQQYPNYLRAAELGNTIVTWYEGPLPDVPVSLPVFREVAPAGKIRSAVKSSHKWGQATAKVWRRAPVLVLLGGWLLAGIFAVLLLAVAGVSRESSPLLTIWTLGFPALIVLQFVLTIRGRFFNKPHNRK